MKGRALVPAIGRRPVTAEDRVQSPASLRWIWGGQSGGGSGFPPSTSVVRCQHRSTNTPYSFANPSPMLHNLGC